MRSILAVALVAALCGPAPIWAKKKKPATAGANPLDRYVAESEARSAVAPPASPGSIWQAGSRLADAARDVRASQVDDVLTIVVAEEASAVTTGVTKTSRASSATNAVNSLAGINPPGGSLVNLANMAGSWQLNGQGTTSRTTTLTTTLTARVTHVLPNGGLVVEASKEIQVNSEHQLITVRGVVRPADIDTTNSVQSSRLAQLEVHIDGKGVVNDAIRRPNFLYRLMMWLLPF
ncbi:MAG: flagellar basal body L-ring protein FlgH [Bryobacteraceae bacterium]|jgi:flagellar L-ring protein precursor FlgH